MFLVTGGSTDSGPTDSTEILDLKVGSWVNSAAKLPHKLSNLQAVNIDDRVLIFGKYIYAQLHSVIVKLPFFSPAQTQLISELTSTSKKFSEAAQVKYL